MTDPRLDALRPHETAGTGVAIRISSIRLSHYRFFAEPIELTISGKNLLVYGENGTGKSSFYRALALLAGQGVSNIGEAGNIFSGQNPEVEVAFSTGQTLIVNADVGSIPEGFSFLKPLAVFVPLLDYKRLLRIHFSVDPNPDRINVYSMLRELFRDYPAVSGGKISDIRSFPEYFKVLDDVVNGQLLGEINDLIHFFSIASSRFRNSLSLPKSMRAGDLTRWSRSPLTTENLQSKAITSS